MFRLDRLAKLVGVGSSERMRRGVARRRKPGRPRLQRLETLERREMMSVTGGWLAGGYSSPGAEVGQAATTEWGPAVITKDQDLGGAVTFPDPGIYHDDVTNTIMIYGTNLADQVEVWQTSIGLPGEMGSHKGVRTHVTMMTSKEFQPGFGLNLGFSITRSETFWGDVAQVKFWGYDGRDVFVNHTTISAVAFGGPGVDVLTGGSGSDFLYGGEDNDTLRGGSGHAELYGEGGDDKLFTGDGGTARMDGGLGMDELTGGSGSDFLYGGPDNDTLRGGGGYDTLCGGAGDDKLYADQGVLYGNAGDDVLVSIGHGVATLQGGPDSDSFWNDPTDVVSDASIWENVNRHVHEVDQFESYSFKNGQIISVDKELNGPDLADPLLENPYGAQISLSNQAENPLFASNGPTKDDVFQGHIADDCYFMAPLSAIAQANPDFIRQMVVDLGDGTYAVRFYKDGDPHYVRVDADLWWSDQAHKPWYAGLGQEDSIWVPIVEKAFAFFRTSDGTYSGIRRGGSPHEYFGAPATEWEINDVATRQEVEAWLNNGQKDGPISDGIDAFAHDLFNWLEQQWTLGNAIVVSSGAGVWDGWDIANDPNSYRPDSHVYMVDSLVTDPNTGDPTGVVLRDPYGKHQRYGASQVGGCFDVSSFAHLYFSFLWWTATDVSPPMPTTLPTGGEYNAGNSTSFDGYAKKPLTEVHPLLGQAHTAVFEELGANTASQKNASTRRVGDRIVDSAFAEFGRVVQSEVTPSEDDQMLLPSAFSPVRAGLGNEWGVVSLGK